MRAVFAGSAEWQEVVFVRRHDSIFESVAVGVGYPIGFEFYTDAACQTDLVVGDLCGGDVEEEWGLTTGRCRPGDGVGAEAWLGSEGRDHAASSTRAGKVAAGHAESDHSLFGGLCGVVSASAEMAGVECGDCAGPVFLRFVDSDLHHLGADMNAQGAIGVDIRGRGGLADGFELWSGIERAGHV